MDLKVFYHNVYYKKIGYKVQVSISHTPEGTNTGVAADEGAELAYTTIRHIYAARVKRIYLCTTPVDSGGVTPEGLTVVSWVLDLSK